MPKYYRKLHIAGPILATYGHCHQYKKYYRTFNVSIHSRDNCFKINGEVCLVKNILRTPFEGFVIIKKFLRKVLFFEAPIDPVLLDIWAVFSLYDNLEVMPIHALEQKLILLPH